MRAIMINPGYIFPIAASPRYPGASLSLANYRNNPLLNNNPTKMTRMVMLARFR